MIISAIPSQYDVGVVSRDFSHADIMSVLEHPKSGIAKQDLPQWQAIELLPEKRTRRQENYAYVHAVFLDYDGHLSLSDFMSAYNGRYIYYLYTSSSHTDAVNKFRVIVPLVEPIPWDVYHHRVTREYLTDLFDIQDTSCFANWHKVPTIPTTLGVQYRYSVNTDGETLDLVARGGRSTTEAVELAHRHEVAAAEDAARKAHHAAKAATSKRSGAVGRARYKAGATRNITAKLLAISSTATGDRYLTLRKIIASAAMAEYADGSGYMFDAQDVEDMLPGYLADARVIRLIADLFSNIQQGDKR